MNSDSMGLVREILEDSYLLTLGVVDEKGPWVAPVTYVFDDTFTLFWMSEKTARHSVAADGKTVAASVVANWKDGQERAVQMTGSVHTVPGRMYDMEERLYAKIGKNVPPKLEEKLATTYSWYSFVPTRIELIHNERYGWDRQRVM